MGTRDNKCEMPYAIAYIRVGRERGIPDSASTLENAKAKIAHRFAKSAHKNEFARVWFLTAGPAELVYTTEPTP